MQTLIPSQTALALGGGGAKGAYEIGVIDALESLGIRAGSAYGTSIGALNAAMYAQGRMDDARALWENLRREDVIPEESLALAKEAETMFDHPAKLAEAAVRHAQDRAIDMRPMEELIRRHVDESRLRGSLVRFGLVATQAPRFSRCEMRLEDMEPGSVCSWLAASAACFPAFPMKTIGEHRYLDGGFCDNVPVGMAIRAGARHIIAADIGAKRSHAQYDRRPNVTYIRASQPLGGLLTFDPARSAKNRIIGYNDTLRAFGHMRGTAYAFDPDDARTLGARARDFLARLTQFEAGLPGEGAAGKKDAPALFAPLEDGLRPGADAVDYFLRALEFIAQAAQLEPAQVLTYASLCDALRAALPLDKAEAMLDALPGGRVGVLFAEPKKDDALIVSCLYRLLEREHAFSPVAMRTLIHHPRALICALALREIL